MRKFGLISSLAFVSLITMYACTLDSTPDPGKNTSDVLLPGNPEAPSASPNETTTDESLGAITDAVVSPLAGCFVTLNWCDKPNDPVGTDCTESGCSSLSTAISACKSIVHSKGCNEHCNAVMRHSNGAPTNTWRFTCGSTCCPEGTQYCGPRGACCDGVHFNSACPPL